jgi:signal transduction histidine kinase
VSAGAAVTMTIDDEARSASMSLQLTVYRAVQEALSNAIRHSPGAEVAIAIAVETRGRRSPAALAVTVVNGPARADTTSLGDLDRGGNGLIGLRERAELVRGSMRAGPTDENGFAVRLELPMAVAAAGPIA